jgi:energy-coupling factor transport system ATP-binding protein
MTRGAPGRGATIELSGVGLAYRGASAPALEDIDLTIAAGESVAIVGPSGSGKTSLLMLIDGLALPTRGAVLVDGLDTRDESSLWDIRRRVGFIFQNPDNQIVSTTVERELAFGLENLGLPRGEIAQRIDEVVRRLDLGALLDRPPHRLSGGEKQRVAIAAVLAMRPTCLALDEPTSLLDGRGRSEVWHALAEVARAGAPTVLHVTQFPGEIALSMRAVVIVGGRIVFDGAPRDLFRRREDLARWGLRRPAGMEVADRLRSAGYAIPDDARTVDELAAALVGRVEGAP